MSVICDAHKKNVYVELLYNSVHRKFNWNLDAVEKTSTQQSGPPGRGWAAQVNGKEKLLWQ